MHKPGIAAVALLASLAVWSVALAQQGTRVARVGYLTASHAMDDDLLALAFLRGLEDLGYVQGRNIVFEKRAAHGRLELLPGLAAELVRANVDVIVAPPTVAARAAVTATRTIPIVFMMVADPVGAGLAASLSRPGGNATGLSNQSGDVAAKMIELLREAVPTAGRLAVMTRTGNSGHDTQWAYAVSAAARLKLTVQRIRVSSYDGVDGALQEVKDLQFDGLVLLSDPVFVSRREDIARAVNEMRLPAIYGFAEFTDAGGLMSYGVNLADQFRRAARYVDRILKGARPGDLPIEQPSAFEFSINAKTAARIGLALPRELRLRADRLIE
ncbi:MAG: ABC transporter substrate-binding protein [Betaproteobacteria bacterium]|nr:ABC transporter substrate-binding protein [Betaproteobacteria bacterium]